MRRFSQASSDASTLGYQINSGLYISTDGVFYFREAANAASFVTWFETAFIDDDFPQISTRDEQYGTILHETLLLMNGYKSYDDEQVSLAAKMLAITLLAGYREAEETGNFDKVLDEAVEQKTFDDGTVVNARTLSQIVSLNGQTYLGMKTFTITTNSFTLKKGKKAQIKAKITLPKGKKYKTLPKPKKIRYLSGGKTVAKVSRKAKITAVGTGKCNIYAYRTNGAWKKAAVTVK